METGRAEERQGRNQAVQDGTAENQVPRAEHQHKRLLSRLIAAHLRLCVSDHGLVEHVQQWAHAMLVALNTRVEEALAVERAQPQRDELAVPAERYQ